MKRLNKLVLIAMIGSLLVIVAPVVILTSFDLPNVGTIASLAGMAVFIAGLQTSLRIALASAGIFTIGAALAVGASGNPWLSALLMGVAAGALGMSTHWGLNKALLMIPIALGFVVSAPPPAGSSTLAPWAITALICLVFGLWAMLVLVVIKRFVPKVPKPDPLSLGRARLFAGTLAIMVAIATWCVVDFGMGHPGGWLILTIFIVFQPFIQDSYTKSLHRAGGTVLGFIIVFAVGSVSTSIWVLSTMGTIAILLAIYAMLLQWPYWQYATFLTAAIVFFESTGPNVLELDVQRLLATFVGVAFSLIVIGLLYPVAKRLAVKRGESHF